MAECEIECPDCEGTGANPDQSAKFDWDCPRCEGFGVIEEDEG